MGTSVVCTYVMVRSFVGIKEPEQVSHVQWACNNEVYRLVVFYCLSSRPARPVHTALYLLPPLSFPLSIVSARVAGLTFICMPTMPQSRL